MNSNQFATLNEVQQMEMIWEKAAFVGERNSDDLKYILYSLNGMYIEEIRHAHYNIWYSYRCIENANEIVRYSQD